MRFRTLLAALGCAGALSLSGCAEEQPLERSNADSESIQRPNDNSKDGAMNASISPDLVNAFAQNEGLTQQVIITLENRSAMATLEAAEGVKVLNAMQSTPIVIAEIDATGLKALSDNPAIKRVEPDGEMRALPE